MTNPTLELNMLRNKLLTQAYSEQGWIGKMGFQLRSILRMRGKSEDRIDEIMHWAEQDLNMAILDIVTDSLQQVQQLAIEYGIEDFVEKVCIKPVGGNFEVTVMDGDMDYSEPQVEMLPRLLMNGKTAKDGSVYRVIPLPTVRGYKARSLSNVDAILERANNIKQEQLLKREQRRTHMREQRELDAYRMTRQLSGSMPRATMVTQEIAPQGKEFRTASSKQDPHTMWVRPARKIDVAEEIMTINTNMNRRIDDATQSIVNRYGI